MKNRLCSFCKIKPIRSRHFNSKYCNDCRLEKLKRPKTSMTKKQIGEAKKLIGKMPRDDIAKKIGVSLTSLKRAFRGTRIAFFNRYAANPELVKKVISYYEENGLRKTEEYFKDHDPVVKVRSVVERYQRSMPRQIRWTTEQIIEAVKMGPFVSYEEQAAYFNRPRAFAGSIESLWQKKNLGSPIATHGWPWNKAKHFVRPECPYIERGCLLQNLGKKYGNYYLWSDMKNHLRGDCPEFIKSAIEALAKFQISLYGSDPRSAINKIRKDRSKDRSKE